MYKYNKKNNLRVKMAVTFNEDPAWNFTRNPKTFQLTRNKNAVPQGEE